jgi:hypothetical protein
MSAGRATCVVAPDLWQRDALVLSGASTYQVRRLVWALIGSLVAPSLTWGAFAVALYLLVAGA